MNKINKNTGFNIDIDEYKDINYFYHMAFTLTYNCENVTLDEDIYFEDPFTHEEYKIGTDVLYENGAYIVEIPKSYFNYEDGTDILYEYIDEFEKAYAKTVSKRLCVGTKYGEAVEQLFEECNVNIIAPLTDNTLHEFLVNEQLI